MLPLERQDAPPGSLDYPMPPTVDCIHLTIVHARRDTRIYLKEVASLFRHGISVGLVVADGLGDAVDDGIPTWDLGKPKGRLARALFGSLRAFRKIRSLNASLVHFHDPELIPLGLLLRMTGRKVIYDVHEDVPRDIMLKDYIPSYLRSFVAGTMSLMEACAGKCFSGIVAATPRIASRFPSAKTIMIHNFPLVGELESDIGWAEKKREICYVGGIAANRGIRELVMAMDLVPDDVRLNLAGRFGEPDVERDVKQMPGWRKVNELGFLDRPGVRATVTRSMAGLVMLQPTSTFVDAMPIKMFEYMSAGIPVIASDFPLWKDIIEKRDCGLCVNPMDFQGIAGAISYFVENPDAARRMGDNGRRAVLDHYNWGVEEKELLKLYLNQGVKTHQ